MYFGQLIDALEPRFKDIDLKLDKERPKAALYVNQAAKWIYRSHFWEYRRKVGELTQIPNYATGTCTVTLFTGTNESAARTVTFSAALPAGLAGRYFQVSGESDWHRILYTSGSTAYLETPVISSDGSGAFKIWKRFYYLPSDVDVITQVGKWSGIGKIESMDPSGLANIVCNLSDEGSPTDFTPFGNDPFVASYATGSLSIAAESNVAEGAGTAWIGNVGSGDILTISNISYRVKRVETDTRMVLHNTFTEAISGSPYSVKKDISLGLQLYPNENAYRVIPFTYFDKAFDMVNEKFDRPNLPEEFDDAILSRAEFKFLKDKDNSRWATVSILFDNEMDTLKSRFRVAQDPYRMFSPKIHPAMPGRF